MVKISLQVSMILENIEEFRPGQSHSYFLKLRCNNCGEMDDIWHDICEDDKVKQDTRNAKGYNMVIKCKLCGRENSMDVVEGSQGKWTLRKACWTIDKCFVCLFKEFTRKTMAVNLRQSSRSTAAVCLLWFLKHTSQYTLPSRHWTSGLRPTKRLHCQRNRQRPNIRRRWNRVRRLDWVRRQEQEQRFHLRI